MSVARVVAYNRGSMLETIILVTAALLVAELISELRTLHAGLEAEMELTCLLQYQLGDMAEDVLQRHRGHQHWEKGQTSGNSQSPYRSERHRYELHLIHVGRDGVEIRGGRKIW